MSDLISVGAAARILDCSSEYVRRLCDDKRLPSIRAERGHRLIPASAVLERLNGKPRLCARCRQELDS